MSQQMMMHSDFRRWILARIDELEMLDQIPDQDDGHGARCGSIAWEAGDRAARLGLPALLDRSRQFEAFSDAPPVKSFLAECLAACPLDAPGEPGAMMTAEETIAYLRLGVDARNPAERLRNLVRRQGLPLVKRGKLRLFRRAAVDAWLERRK